MQADRPLSGIALMVAFCVLAPLADGVAKILTSDFPILQLLLIRYATQAALFWGLLRARGNRMPATPRILVLMALRTALLVGATGTMLAALSVLPLAVAISIAYVMPFLLLVIGHFALGEEVGWRRGLACAAGFAGTLLILQPSLAEVGWAACLPLLVALLFALFMLVTRVASRDIGPVEMQAATGVIASAVLFPLLVVGDARAIPGLAPAAADLADLGLLAVFAALAAAAHLTLTFAVARAPTATLAPFQYLEIPVATLAGWAIFGDLPAPSAGLGIAVTIGAGLYLALRERLPREAH